MRIQLDFYWRNRSFNSRQPAWASSPRVRLWLCPDSLTFSALGVSDSFPIVISHPAGRLERKTKTCILDSCIFQRKVCLTFKGCHTNVHTSEPPSLTSEPPSLTSEPPSRTSEPPSRTSEPPSLTSEPPSRTLLYFTWLYFTWLDFTLLYFTLLYFTWLTLLYFTLLYFTLLYFTLLYFTLLYFTSLHFTLLYFTILIY